MDIMFVHPRRWERLNDRAYKNTQEEKRRLNNFMERWLEVGELIKNRTKIRRLLEKVGYEIPRRPIEARRVMGFKQCLANIILIIEKVYGSVDTDL